MEKRCTIGTFQIKINIMVESLKVHWKSTVRYERFSKELVNIVPLLSSFLIYFARKNLNIRTISNCFNIQYLISSKSRLLWHQRTSGLISNSYVPWSVLSFCLSRRRVRNETLFICCACVSSRNWLITLAWTELFPPSPVFKIFGFTPG